VAVPDYVVSFTEAMRAWALDDDPPIHEYDAVDDWLNGLETEGPPPIIGYTVQGLRIARAPNGVRVFYDVVAAPLDMAPPYGIIAIKRIRSSGR
jgi:hypothetical protein